MIDHKRPISLDIWLHYWMPWIRNRLSILDDDESVIQDWINKGLNNSEQVNIGGLIQTEKAICFGAGPNLEKHIKLILEKNLDSIGIISADGATNRLIEHSIIPDLVLTDLDGLTPENIVDLSKQNTNILALAHGDNQNKVQDFLEYIEYTVPKNLIWCTQGRPKSNWVNTMGFTDGDRAVGISYLNKLTPLLLGYELPSKFIGKYSKPYFKKDMNMTPRKLIKLNIAKKILLWFNYNMSVYTIDYNYVPGIEITIDDFWNL